MIMKLPDYILLSILLLLVAGCGTGPAKAPSSAKSVATLPLTDEECIAYANNLEQLIIAGDAKAATAMVDWSAMVDEALAGLSASEEEVPYFVGTRKGTLRAAPETFETIAAQKVDGGSYRFLRVRSGPEGKRVLFRLRMGNNGFNYHEIFLMRKAGKCIGYDVYAHRSGERRALKSLR